MSPVELFKAVTEKGSYIIGWTKEIQLEARSPDEAMLLTQNRIGNITNVVYVERG